MPDLKDIVYYIISTTGIVMTGIFSYLVWKATQKSNELSKQNNEIAKQNIELISAMALTEQQQ